MTLGDAFETSVSHFRAAAFQGELASAGKIGLSNQMRLSFQIIEQDLKEVGAASSLLLLDRNWRFESAWVKATGS